MIAGISLFQIIVLVFVLFALSRALLRFRDRKIALGSLLFWSCLWLAVLALLFIPGITEPLAALLNIGRGVDVAVYLSIMLLFYLMFRLYVRIEKLEQNITTAVRQSAIASAGVSAQASAKDGKKETKKETKKSRKMREVQ